MNTNETLHYGTWTHDDAGLPCFDGRFEGAVAVNHPFTHGVSSGRLQALINRHGLVHLFTTEGGHLDLSANTFRGRSGLYIEIETHGDRHTLVHADLDEKTSVRYGIGYARFVGVWRDGKGSALEIEQEFYTPPDRHPRLIGQFHVRNIGKHRFEGRIRLRADVEPARKTGDLPRPLVAFTGSLSWPDFHPGLGDYQLVAGPGFAASPAEGVSLLMASPLQLAPQGSRIVVAQVGYGAEPLPVAVSPQASRLAWARRLSGLALPGHDAWIRDEALWCAGQLYSHEAWDSSVGEHYLNLGGYGWIGFGVREVPETALAIAAYDPKLAFTCLRWTAKVQYDNGDLPHCHAFRRPAPGATLDTGHRESDNEIWFVLACAEVVHLTGNLAFLDEVVPFWNDEPAAVWEHLRRAVDWIFTGVGLGAHGLVRIAEGDWNDYLSHVGARGHGESMMNTGMACRALDRLIPLARGRDPGFAALCASRLAALRAAASAAFHSRWFARGYTDDGVPFGTPAEDRLFLNAQSWCVLGGCGTVEMRESAMRSVLEKCHSDIGLTLMSRPFPAPPPPDVSTCPIPPGDGENSGVWPQTVHWAVWALAELGWTAEALDVWRRMSLRNHSRLHPEVPYGIFNGPDCYSSHHAGEREGWTQMEMLDRAKFPPMNPMVAWQSFSLDRIARIVPANVPQLATT